MRHKDRRRLDPLAAMLLSIAALCVSCSVSNPLPSGTDTERVVLDLLREMDTAWVRGDVATIRRLRADDYRSTFLDGQVYDKEIGIREIESGSFKLESGASDDVSVRVFGNTAIVTGRWRAEGTFDGKPFTTNERFTVVFLNRQGVWQIVAEHYSRNEEGKRIFSK